MANPLSLIGDTERVTLDGIDLHLYGMIITKIENPSPQPQSSSIPNPMRHGDFDFTRAYGPRTIKLTGHIIGDNNSDLMSRIDSLKNMFRLRENGQSFQVIFKNQSTRYWTCRYDGGFSISPNANWYTGRTAAFSLQLKCIYPYAQAVSSTSVSAELNIFKNLKFTYAGNVQTPFNLEIEPVMKANLLEQAVSADPGEDNTKWVAVNSAVTKVANPGTGYGSYVIRATQSGAGDFGAKIDVSAVIDKTKYYVFGITHICAEAVAKSANARLEVLVDGSVIKTVTAAGAGGCFIPVKVGPTDFGNPITVEFQVILDDDSAATVFDFDGGFIYEITASDYSSSTYLPPPYVSDPNGDYKRNLAQPKARLHKSINLLENGKGDSVTDWQDYQTGTGFANIYSGIDPLNTGIKCIVVGAGSGSGIAAALSPKVYVQGGQPCHVSLNYMVRALVGTGMTISILEKSEDMADDGIGYIVKTDLVTITAEGTTWLTASSKITLNSGTRYIQVAFMFSTTAQTITLFMKNIQVVAPTLVTDDLDAYVDFQKNEFSMADSFEEDDVLTVDSDFMTVTKIDDSAKTLANDMANFTGERLLLEPGVNTLRLLDARDSATNPETASCGVATVKLNYRARYL